MCQKIYQLSIICILVACCWGCKPKERTATIATDLGNIKIKLYNETPIHRDNFIKLVESGYYNGTLFHRVVPQFMVQGGDPDSKNAQPGQALGNGEPGYTLEAEIVPTLMHKRGALAAARLGDQENPQRRSSGSQFYLVQGRIFTDDEMNLIEQQRGIKLGAEQREIYKKQGGTPQLDSQYTVFGETVSGLDVVDKIAAAQRDALDRPVQDIKMQISMDK